jgi:hypothetical protein
VPASLVGQDPKLQWVKGAISRAKTIADVGAISTANGDFLGKLGGNVKAQVSDWFENRRAEIEDAARG